MIPLFLCWGSFLNVLAYRLVRNQSIVAPRSQCPVCKQQLAWYDIIPVISYFMLGGKCRYCDTPISFLYPFIELITVLFMSLLWLQVPLIYFPAYFIFFSALLVTIRSDIETMLISRFVTVFLIPLGVIFSVFNLLPISPLESIVGMLLGYSFLYSIAWLMLALTGKQGIGDGDLELLAFIGAFTGPMGCWISLLLGSILGSFVGIIYLASKRLTRDTPIPFGPFLALGAIIFVLCAKQLSSFLFVVN